MTITEHPTEYRNRPWSDAQSEADTVELREPAKPARRPLAVSLVAVIVLLGLMAVAALLVGGWIAGRSGTNGPDLDPTC